MAAYIQSNAVTGFGTTNCPYTASQTANNTNVVCILCTGTGATIQDTVISGTSNTYVQAVTDLHSGSVANFYYFSVFYCLSIKTAGAGARSVTVIGGSTCLNIDIAEYSGVAGAVDGSPVTFATRGVATGSVSITPTSANDLLVGFMNLDNTGSGITTSGTFTQRRTSTGGYNGAISDRIAAPTTASTCTWNWTTADEFYGAVIAFKTGTVITPPLVQGGDTRFGFSTHFGQPTGNSKLMMPGVAATGVGWIRDNISWPDFNPSNGVFTVYPQDNGWIVAAQQAGLSVVAIIGGNTLVGTNPPYDATAMGAFAAWFSGQYAGTVLALEIINEPDTNIPAFAGAAGETKYEQLITAVTAAVHAGPAPSCHVIGCTYKGSVLISMLPFCTMDGVSYHPYDPGSSPNVIPELVYEPPYNTFVQQYPQWIAALGNATSLAKWETEWGCATVAGLTQSMQCTYLVRRMLLATAFAVDHSFIYEYIDFGADGYGIAVAGGVVGTIVAKTAYAVVQNLISTLQGVSGSSIQATTSQVTLTVNGTLTGNTKGYSYLYTGTNKTIVSYWLGDNAPQNPPASITASLHFPYTQTFTANSVVYDPIANTSVPFSNFTSSLSGGVLTVSNLPISDQPQLIILQGFNPVTVTFSGLATTVDIEALEYTNVGAPPSEVDGVAKTATGTSTTPATAALSTTQASDLLVGAASSAGGPLTPGASFVQRAITSRLITEDELASTVGSYPGLAHTTSSSAWVMQVVALESSGTVVSGTTETVSGPHTAQAFGVVTVTDSFNFNYAGIQTAQDAGTVIVIAPFAFSVTGPTTAQDSGAITVSAPFKFTYSGIQTAQDAGTVNVAAPFTFSVTGPTTAQSFSTVLVSTSFIFSFTGIQSNENFTTVNVTTAFVFSFSGITSAEDFGPVTENILIPGVPSDENFGSVAFTAPASFSFSGILSRESFTTVLQSEAAIFQAASIPSTENFTTVTVDSSYFFSFLGITSNEDFSTIQVSSPNAFSFSGITTAQAFGAIFPFEDLIFTGVPSFEDFGNVTFNADSSFSFIGIPGSESFTTVSQKSPAAFQSASIVSAQAFTTVSVNSNYAFSFSGILSDETFSTVSFNADSSFVFSGILTTQSLGVVNVFPLIIISGVLSDESFGSVILNAPSSFSFTGIPSAEDFTIVLQAQAIHSTSILSAQSFSSVSFNADSLFSISGILSSESFSTVSSNADSSFVVSGVLTAQSFGVVNLLTVVNIPGVLSDESFGSVTFDASSSFSFLGIPVSESFTSVSTNSDSIFQSASILSAQRFSVSVNASYLFSFTGITTHETFTTVSFTSPTSFLVSGVLTAQAFGVILFLPATNIPGILSDESFGSVTFDASASFSFSGIPSFENFTTVLQSTAIVVQSISIPTSESFVMVSVTSDFSFSIPGVQSAESFSTVGFNADSVFSVIGNDTDQAFGNILVIPAIKITGVFSAQSFAHPALSAPMSYSLTGILSRESFTMVLQTQALVVQSGSVRSSESFGNVYASRMGSPILRGRVL